jgi:hypothetical protein
MTWALVGSSCIEATRVQYQGEDAVMFVFGVRPSFVPSLLFLMTDVASFIPNDAGPGR